MRRASDPCRVILRAPREAALLLVRGRDRGRRGGDGGGGPALGLPDRVQEAGELVADDAADPGLHRDRGLLLGLALELLLLHAVLPGLVHAGPGGAVLPLLRVRQALV